MKVNCSDHGCERLMERMHLSSEEVETITKLAWTRGCKVTQFKEGAREHYSARRDNHEGESFYRIYKGFCFVFTLEGALVTAYADPRKPKRKYDSHRSYGSYMLPYAG